MERLRTPLQGVRNIIRFNRHLYMIAAASFASFFIAALFLPGSYSQIASFAGVSVGAVIATSLLVSLYVYDLSGLYTLQWLDGLPVARNGIVANIHAGFDETSSLLRNKYPEVELHVFDFYDAKKHTEVSLDRARNSGIGYSESVQMTTSRLPLPDSSVETIYILFAAHEIRREEERIEFFRGLKRALKDNGKVILTEHLRDLPNFLAYNIGFFHFMPRSTWIEAFEGSGLRVLQEDKLTPFVTTFVLQKHGDKS